LEAAVGLEGYAIECAEQISNDILAGESDGHAGTFVYGVLELPELKIVAGFVRWRKAAIAARLMAFPQEVRQSNQLLTFTWTVTADDNQVRRAAASEVRKSGLRALDLARDLRKAFRLPARHLLFGEFNIRETLESIDANGDQ